MLRRPARVLTSVELFRLASLVGVNREIGIAAGGGTGGLASSRTRTPKKGRAANSGAGQLRKRSHLHLVHVGSFRDRIVGVTEDSAALAALLFNLLSELCRRVGVGHGGLVDASTSR